MKKRYTTQSKLHSGFGGTPTAPECLGAHRILCSSYMKVHQNGRAGSSIPIAVGMPRKLDNMHQPFF